MGAEDNGRRTVVVHHHFFKCAGTSVAHALQDAFGERYAAWEGPHNWILTRSELAALLESHPRVTAVSSHTAEFPPPLVEGTTIIPIVFLRHPLDRARSVYEFERRQREPTLGAQMAKRNDLAGYIRWGLEKDGADPRIAEFQTSRLGGRDRATRRERAMAALAELPFVGTVEDYATSLAALESLLAGTWPGIRLKVYHDNSSKGGSLEDRLAHMRTQIGTELYEKLEAANQGDLALWRAAVDRYRPAVT